MDAISSYHQVKDALSVSAGVTHQTLHIHAGLAIYIVAQLVIGTRRASLAALLAVCGAEFLNEGLDWLFHGELLMEDTLADILATLFWPIILFTASAFRRHQWRAKIEQRNRLRVALARLTGSPAPVRQRTA